MPKLTKVYYKLLKTNERKLNCYLVNISKEIVNSTNLEGKELKIYAKNNKIIIESVNLSI